MNAPINCANILAKTHCITSHKGKTLPVKGNDTILTFVNENCDPLVKVDIDCLLKGIVNPPKHCDFMVQHKNINYYVELKTGNPEGACNQIASTINIFNKCFSDKKCKAIIVVFAPIGMPFIARFQKQFKDEFKKSDLRKYVRSGICDMPKIETAPGAFYPLS